VIYSCVEERISLSVPEEYRDSSVLNLHAERVGVGLILRICFTEGLDGNLGRDIRYIKWNSHGFLQTLQENGGMITSLRPKLFPFHHSRVTISFDGMCSVD
jgi:hypothetical protein